MKRSAPAAGGYLVPHASRQRTEGPAVGKGGGLGQASQQVAIAVKVLLGAHETSAVLGHGGATSREIGQQTGTKLHFSKRHEYYPGTSLQELTIRGDSTDGVATALLTSLSRVFESGGKVCGADQDVEEGNARVRMVLPVTSCRALIGKGGENIKVLRQQHGIKVHIDEVALGAGEIAEQLVTINGTFDGVQGSLPNVVERVQEVSEAPWFSSWAMTSHAGSGDNVVASQVAKGKGGSKGGQEAGGHGAPQRTTYTSVAALGGGGAKGPPSGGKGGGAAGFKGWGKEAETFNGWGDGGSQSYGKAKGGAKGGWQAQAAPADPDLEVFSYALQRLPQAAAYDRRQMISFPIPAGVVSAVIGRGGAITKEISGTTGAKVMIREVEENPEEKMCQISGNVVAIAAAYIHVMGRVNEAGATLASKGLSKGGGGKNGGKSYGKGKHKGEGGEEAAEGAEGAEGELGDAEGGEEDPLLAELSAGFDGQVWDEAIGAFVPA